MSIFGKAGLKYDVEPEKAVKEAILLLSVSGTLKLMPLVLIARVSISGSASGLFFFKLQTNTIYF